MARKEEETFEPSKKKVKHNPTNDEDDEIEKEYPRVLEDDNTIATSEKFFIFLLDGSSSLQSDDFKRQVSVATSLLSKFGEDKNNLFALVQFSTISKIVHRRTSCASHVIKETEAMVQLGGSTNMVSALEQAENMFLTESIRNPKKIIIIFTDGSPDDKQGTISIADRLKIKHNVDIFCFGFGKQVKLNTIQAIASPKFGHCVNDWDQIQGTLESLMGGIDRPVEQNTIRFRISLQNRPMKFGDEAKLQIRIFNQTDDKIEEGSKIIVQGNTYFSYAEDRIIKEIAPKTTALYALTLYTNDNVTIDKLSKSLTFHLVDKNGKLLYERTKSLWVGDFCKELINFTPIDVPFLNIGLFGTMGSGKSSFFNSVCTLLNGSVATAGEFQEFAPIANTGDHVTTKITRYHLPTIMDEGPLSNIKFDIWDTFGLTTETYNNEEFKKFLNGELPENFSLNQAGNQSSTNKKDNYDRKMHTVIFIIDQGERGDDNIMKKLKTMYKTAIEYGITPIVVATKIDGIYGIESLDKVKEEFSNHVGASKLFIFTAENYHNNMEQNFVIDKNTYKIIDRALKQGLLYLKGLRNTRRK